MQSVSAGLTHPRVSTPGSRSFALHASILIALLAASSAPTPLYSRYQEQWHLSALDITVVFSTYALALLAALLTTGTLSDHLGRRPVLVGALGLQIIAMALFATAGGLAALLVARLLQGIATGAATSAAGAALIDHENPARPGRSALANSISPVSGMAAGVLIATLLVHFAPAPTTTVYAALAAVFAAQAVALTRTPESALPHPGGLRSMRPHLTLPATARPAFLLNGAGVVAVWALGGFYSSLGPAFTRLISPDGPEAAGGMVFFTLTAVAAPTVYLTRRRQADVLVLLGSCAAIPAAGLSLGALFLGSETLLFAGAAMAGFAFGAVSQGALRAVVDSVTAHEKSGTLASYYVLSYLAMSLPAIGAGAIASDFGLRTAAVSYACCVAALAVLSITALSAPLRTGQRTSPGPAAPGPTTTDTASTGSDAITLIPCARPVHNS
ncbi:MFS transporter [Streptomyces sp. NPDC059814]|uniref:MFS transporter n=1 Tax=Streptomyces sp. NPDC059814 TaxID=3346959 RepID=UPI0036659D28